MSIYALAGLVYDRKVAAYWVCIKEPFADDAFPFVNVVLESNYFCHKIMIHLFGL